MSKRKLDAKAFAQQKRKHRQWLTFLRMCSYGINNFSRNAWLTVAATAIMTITLLIVFMTIAARNVLVDTLGQIKNNVDMSIYVKTSTDAKDIDVIDADLRKLSTVTSVKYVTPDEARADFAQRNKSRSGVLNALNEASNQFPGTFRVKVSDINNTSELKHFTATNQTYLKNKDSSQEPSFEGPHKVAIANIGRWVVFAQNAGLVASVVFIALSSLIVFNNIRMAIFNRKDEIQMMKLIGADRSFIRGPFLVEAVVYGCIAAAVATGLGMLILYSTKDKLLSYEVSVGHTVTMATDYIILVVFGMIVLGSLIGVISSLLATRRYLKI